MERYRSQPEAAPNLNRYPYAYPITYRFIMAAIREGAHRKLPKKLQRYKNGWDRWVKKRNIAFIYFSSPAVEDEIGCMYGYGINSRSAEPNRREAVRDHVKTFIEMLRENCSPRLQSIFPLDEILLDKPQTSISLQRRADAISLAQGGIKFQVLPLFNSGLEPKDIVATTNIHYSSVVSVIKREVKKE